MAQDWTVGSLFHCLKLHFKKKWKLRKTQFLGRHNNEPVCFHCVVKKLFTFIFTICFCHLLFLIKQLIFFRYTIFWLSVTQYLGQHSISINDQNFDLESQKFKHGALHKMLYYCKCSLLSFHKQQQHLTTWNERTGAKENVKVWGPQYCYILQLIVLRA